MTDDKTANPPVDSIEDAQDAGYLGVHPDPEPNESYTVEGVLKSAAEADKASDTSSKSTASKSTSSKSSS